MARRKEGIIPTSHNGKDHQKYYSNVPFRIIERNPIPISFLDLFSPMQSSIVQVILHSQNKGRWRM